MTNKNFYYAVCAAVGFFLIAMTVQGCDLQKMIDVDVPRDVQKSIGSEETISLADSTYEWNRWQDWVSTNSEAFARNIDAGNERVALIESITALGIGALGEVSTTFPGGAVVFSGLSLLAGWFLKKPGTDKVVAKEKEDSYNAGIEKGKTIAATVMDAVEEIKES